MTDVLVVDDSPVDQRLASGILEKNAGVQVRTASNGAEALEAIRSRRPDVVVTDLQMPEMNGLQLVEAVRADYPILPVILMTAHGSEEIAVSALEAGASSYVSKANLANYLLDTVENVMAVARADRRHDQLIECLTETRATFVLKNDPALIPPLVDHLQEQIVRMNLCDETARIRVGIALEEALLNALYHGNLELSTDELREASSNLLQSEGEDAVLTRAGEAPYADRRITVNSFLTPEAASYTIQDDGPGFDPSKIPDLSDPANLERQSGRGLVLMRTFMDQLDFNETGNRVTMVKRRDVKS
jgi:CheY-like chemotaxis protein/anti-sigma regulatory factor (Ser/Thr protein kinase)